MNTPLSPDAGDRMSIQVNLTVLQEREALEHQLRRLSHAVLLGQPGAAEQLRAQFATANIAWQEHALVLIALLLRPQTTLEGIRELLDMALIHPLLCYRLTQKTPEVNLLKYYGVAFEQIHSTQVAVRAGY